MFNDKVKTQDVATGSLIAGSASSESATAKGVYTIQCHDKDGIVWPTSVAPFEVCLTPLTVTPGSAPRELADKVRLFEQGESLRLVSGHAQSFQQQAPECVAAEGIAASRRFLHRLFELAGPDGPVHLSFLTVDGRRIAAPTPARGVADHGAHPDSCAVHQHPRHHHASPAGAAA